ncbi:cysteine-rich receptor-like protein kinase 10 [Prunus yedoensis var. nudiflora]|uniref:Cysteine-rich receptor-like protein kinase 10 n=1 Tax=Prunus yedoensis var. nudiflora TaxID=2094558 RepID=A0A314YBB2_PRUYE|nr:cysteine-rich receptor-like protein kinase 10 [Prunus yedoensis var. nudiflora]
MDAIQRCPNGKGIVIWYDECMLRYSDQPFFSTAVNTPRNFLRSSTDAMQPPVGFNQVLETTMNQLLTKAAANNTNGTVLKYFATEEDQIKGFNNDTLYSLGQCTPDLSSADCKWCLEEAVGHIVSKEYQYQGGRFLYPSCYIRYQLSPFYGTAIDEDFLPMLRYGRTNA